jgi:GH15 family glucan-1,4-alpha-glucosidase
MSVEIYPPIADYALLSDCHSGALVSKDGSIDWCTFHRYEARPVFARILDWAKAGFFRIAPLDDEYESTRRYLPGTKVLETTFRTASGTLALTDFFAFRRPGEGEDARSAHPDHQLIRIARCTEGEVAVKVKLVPRFDYGLTTPRLETLADDLVIVYGGADALVLQSELPFGHAERSATEGNRTLRAGDEAFVVLTYQLPHELAPRRLTRAEVHAKLDEMTSTWAGWAARCTYDGPYREQVVRSALVLKALTNGPTGAIVAAATTSLPEEIGGERNWDYRFTWLPLHVAARLGAHAQRALRARLHRGGARVHGVAAAHDRGAGARAADHVRRRRRAAAARGRARVARGLPWFAPRAHWQRRLLAVPARRLR